MGEDITEKKKIVISGINLFEGGTLSIIKDCLVYLNESKYSDDYSIVALVNRISLYQDLKLENIKLIEFPSARQNYLKRLFYEYYYFLQLSKRWDSALWVSLHDVTPNVKAKTQVVYCHNPAPFYNLSIKEFLLEPKLGFFNQFYSLLYRINIQKNTYVIVQQDWLREKFSKIFAIDRKKIIVAHPNVPQFLSLPRKTSQKTRFIFPTLSRVFKNIQIVGDAAQVLQENGISDFEIIITIDGTENQYARWINKRYGHLPSLNFIGIQSREKIFELYSESDCLIFPSKLETWGLPISEFKQTKKPILLADLPYAHETIGNYESVCFFDPLSKQDLADKMQKIISGNTSIFKSSAQETINQPMANNWNELFKIILH